MSDWSCSSESSTEMSFPSYDVMEGILQIEQGYDTRCHIDMENVFNLCLAIVIDDNDSADLTTQIRSIGERLHERGGLHLMQTCLDTFQDMIFYLVEVKDRPRSLLGCARMVDRIWDGIGEWRG